MCLLCSYVQAEPEASLHFSIMKQVSDFCSRGFCIAQHLIWSRNLNNILLIHKGITGVMGARGGDIMHVPHVTCLGMMSNVHRIWAAPPGGVKFVAWGGIWYCDINFLYIIGKKLLTVLHIFWYRGFSYRALIYTCKFNTILVDVIFAL